LTAGTVAAVHQSGTLGNIGPQSPMYDTLLRRDPKDGQTIIPDLAHRAPRRPLHPPSAR